MEILLVEDNPADVRMMREALRLTGLDHRLSVAVDGEQALRFLRQEQEFATAPRPEVVILDLKLPKISGHAVLGAIKVDPDLCSIPVLVLTSSHAQRDMMKSYDLKADHYVTKPVGLDVLAAEMKIIEGLIST